MQSLKQQNSCCISSDFSIANSSHILFIFLNPNPTQL